MGTNKEFSESTLYKEWQKLEKVIMSTKTPEQAESAERYRMLFWKKWSTKINYVHAGAFMFSVMSEHEVYQKEHYKKTIKS